MWTTSGQGLRKVDTRRYWWYRTTCYTRWRHVKVGRNGRRISLWPFSPDDVFSALLRQNRAQEPESSKEQKGERQPDSRSDQGGGSDRRDG